MSELNKYSKTVTQDPTQPAAQAMLHAAELWLTAATADLIKAFEACKSELDQYFNLISMKYWPT